LKSQELSVRIKVEGAVLLKWRRERRRRAEKQRKFTQNFLLSQNKYCFFRGFII
jgi:hypothetical protein